MLKNRQCIWVLTTDVFHTLFHTCFIPSSTRFIPLALKVTFPAFWGVWLALATQAALYINPRDAKESAMHLSLDRRCVSHVVSYVFHTLLDVFHTLGAQVDVFSMLGSACSCNAGRSVCQVKRCQRLSNASESWPPMCSTHCFIRVSYPLRRVSYPWRSSWRFQHLTGCSASSCNMSPGGWETWPCRRCF